jgi:hypothetical protein
MPRGRLAVAGNFGVKSNQEDGKKQYDYTRVVLALDFQSQIGRGCSSVSWKCSAFFMGIIRCSPGARYLVLRSADPETRDL